MRFSEICITASTHAEIIEITDKNGTLSQIAYVYSEEEHEWEFRDFNLE